jgi:hypothetical protein
MVNGCLTPLFMGAGAFGLVVELLLTLEHPTKTKANPASAQQIGHDSTRIS